MKYIIMCDGKGTRWENYKNIPKHFVTINGEPLIKRTIRQLNERVNNCEIIITSHDKRYDIEGSTRYEPLNNVLEIDRFTEELIDDNICFLYGDTYYPDEVIDSIISKKASDILFFGNAKSIVAIKIKDGKLFKKHVSIVRKLFLDGKIKNCKGWQVYQSFVGLEFDKKQIGEKFVLVNKDTIDFNTPKEYENSKLQKDDDKK